MNSLGSELLFGIFLVLGVSGSLPFSAEELHVLVESGQLLPQDLALQCWCN